MNYLRILESILYLRLYCLLLRHNFERILAYYGQHFSTVLI